MRRSGKERRRKWRGDRVYQDRASFVGNYARGYEALGSTKRPLLKTFTLSLWSEEDAQNLQANKRE